MAQPMVDADAAGPREEIHPFEFHGTAGEYFRIWIVNVCLTILTLGIYSAWAKVRTERYFAASTRLAGASFDYHADPMSILKGRLIVLGVVVLTSAAAAFAPLLEALIGFGLFLVVPWAIIRSLAFKAHNTSWRSIRFAFGARYGDAFAAYVGFPTLAVLTLGILFPYSLFRQRKFIVDHAAFGTTRFVFGNGPGAFYRVFGVVLGLIVLGFVLAGGAGAALGEELGGPLAAGLLIPVYFAVAATIAAAIINLTYRNATLGPHRLASDVPALGLGWLYASNALAILLSLGLLIPWAQVRLARYRLAHMRVTAVGSLDDFVAGQGEDVSSLGAEFGEAFDLDIGL